MNKEKIIILHHCDALGGAGISLLNVYKMLKENYDIKVYLPHNNSQLADFYKKQGVEVYAINGEVGMISAYSGGIKVLSRTFIKNLLKTKKTKKILQQVINHEKPDIVAVNSMTLAWAGKLIQKNNVKSLCFVRETYINNLGMRYIQHCLDRWFNGVIFISKYDFNKFNCKAPITGIVSNCIHKEDYSIDLSRKKACDELEIDNDAFNVLFVGGTDELKGWLVIANALEKLEKYNINLVVAGGLVESKVVKSDKIKYIGLQSEMCKVYRACDVLAFPSTSPHQARPAFEAGMMGLPVIISDFEETRENVQDRINGLTFTPSNSYDLSCKILTMFKDKELCRKLGQENYKHALQFHEYENCKKILLDLVNKFIKN
jgi:glycosyltransferase involved in cell wall biosynthesis